MIDAHRPLYASLKRHGVDYVVIGGIAAIVHGVPRVTLDIDLLIRATRANAERLLAALLEAGLDTAALLDADELLAHEVTVFRDRIRVDVQTSSPGIRFEEVRPRALMLAIGDIEVPILAPADPRKLQGEHAARARAPGALQRLARPARAAGARA